MRRLSCFVALLSLAACTGGDPGDSPSLVGVVVLLFGGVILSGLALFLA